MPLIKSKSKEAFSKNVEQEMHAGKPQKQALAIAYAVKRKSKKPKKMAEGGTVKDNDQEKSPPSAKSESRPMPPRKDDSGKAPKHDDWLDDVTVKQAQRPSKTPLSRPKIASSGGPFSVRDREDIEDDLHKMSSEPPASPKQQPSKKRDEIGPNRKGPDVPALHMKKMAYGGDINCEVPFSEAEEDHEPGIHPGDGDDMERRPPSKEYMAGYMAGRYARGGEVDSPKASISYEDKPDTGHGAIIFKAEGGDIERGDLSKARGEAQDDQDRAQIEYESHAPELYEEDKSKRERYAHGGDVHDIDVDELEDEKHSSIAAAIMAKRDRMKPGSDSDEDREMMMAEGGHINGHGSMDSDDSDQVDLKRNAEEDANEEDQASFDAMRKENYSESDGLRQMGSPEDSNRIGDDREDEESDPHDMVGSIRRKMSMRRQFSR